MQTHFSTAIVISAPAERVWTVMSDVERWHEWTPTVTSIKRLDEGPLAVGKRASIRQPKLFPATWKVIAFDPGRSFTWTTTGPGVLVTAHHGVEALPDGTTRATLSIAYSGLLASLLAWLTLGINDRYLGLEAAGLKRRSEEG
jgi:uncharacterized membrane protein